MVLMVRGTPVTPRRVLVWVLGASLLLLALYLRMAWSAGRAELREMCERDLPPKVYRKVSAPGYYENHVSCLENGCWEILIDKPYRFIEYENVTPYYLEPIKEPGFYRATKVRIDSGLCDERVSEQLRTWALYRPYYDAGNCIRIEKIETPSARYGLFVDKLPRIKLDNYFGSVIKQLHTYIKDMEADEIVAEQTSAMLFQNSMPSFSSFQSMLHCRTRGIMENPAVSDVGLLVEFVTPE